MHSLILVLILSLFKLLRRFLRKGHRHKLLSVSVNLSLSRPQRRIHRFFFCFEAKTLILCCLFVWLRAILPEIQRIPDWKQMFASRIKVYYILASLMRRFKYKTMAGTPTGPGVHDETGRAPQPTNPGTLRCESKNIARTNVEWCYRNVTTTSKLSAEPFQMAIEIPGAMVGWESWVRRNHLWQELPQ